MQSNLIYLLLESQTHRRRADNPYPVEIPGIIGSFCLLNLPRGYLSIYNKTVVIGLAA